MPYFTEAAANGIYPLNGGATSDTTDPTPVSASAIIEVEGINKIYGGEIAALNDISLKFNRGEMACLLGPSG